VPPIARPYWAPGGPVMPTMGISGVEARVRFASECTDDLSLSFVAQDPDPRVREAAARNPNMPRIIRDSIGGDTGHTVEDAAAIWFDVWKTDPNEVIAGFASDPRLANVLLARGYFAEDFDDVDTARTWYLAANSIGVLEARANLARLSAAEGDNRAAREWAIPAARQGNQSAQKVLATLGEQADGPSSGGCYIATAVYGSYDAPEVRTLRRFRDEHLALSVAGRAAIAVYYWLSPPIAKRFTRADFLSRSIRRLLDAIVRRLCRRRSRTRPKRRLKTRPPRPDWVGDLLGRLGVDQAAGRGRGSAAPGREGPRCREGHGGCGGAV